MASAEKGTTVKGRQTKERIITETMKLINQKGYEQTTLVDICQAADVSNGAFYHYFNSKQDILLGYLEKESQDLDNYYNALKKDSYIDVLYSVISYQVTYYIIKGQDSISNLFSTMLLSKRNFFFLEDYVGMRILRDCFENGQKNGEFRTDIDFGSMAYSIFSIIYMVVSSWCMDEGSFDLFTMMSERIVPLVNVYTEKPSHSDK